MQPFDGPGLVGMQPELRHRKDMRSGVREFLRLTARSWANYRCSGFAGIPTTVVPGSTSFVTTAPAPTVASSPTSTY